MAEKKRLKREILEWGIMITVIATLYLTGLHTEVIGRLQSLVVMSGIMQPSVEEEATLAAYDLLLEDVHGDRISMQTMKGETIFLNIWATWCPPCIAEMPDIHSLYEEVKGDVAFVMISRDEDEEKARSWIAKKGYEFPVYFLRSRLPEAYQSNVIPTTYVVSPDGYVTVRNTGMAKYNTEEFKSYLRGL